MTPLRPSEDKRDFIEQTLLALREGHGSIADTTELRALLMRDPEARRVYLRSNQLDSMLETLPLDAELPAPPSAPRFRIGRSHLLSAALGAGLAALLAVMIFLKPVRDPGHQAANDDASPDNQPYASLSADFDALIHGAAPNGHQSFGEGELSLDRGIAQLAFRNGASIVLEGKCGFEILNENTVVLTYGKMWAHCPAEARGFKVLTPNGREIIDLGTEFGVEVTLDGETDVHVFDGLVDVVAPRAQTQRLEAGTALLWAGNSITPTKLPADFDKFTTAESLAQKRLAAYHADLLQREDLLLYYDFADLQKHKILNRARNAGSRTTGHISGATSVAGRAEGETALQFEHPDDSVALDLSFPKATRSMTTAMWVKIDRHDYSLSTLLNTVDWQPGAIHLQLGQDGNLKTGINGGASFSSPSGSVSTGTWHFLAVSWDFDTQTARLYCDGRPLKSIRGSNYTPPALTLRPQFGPSLLASWEDPQTMKNRDLRGRIDEVLIFDHALSAEEITKLYQDGRP